MFGLDETKGFEVHPYFDDENISSKMFALTFQGLPYLPFHIARQLGLRGQEYIEILKRHGAIEAETTNLVFNNKQDAKNAEEELNILYRLIKGS